MISIGICDNSPVSTSTLSQIIESYLKTKGYTYILSAYNSGLELLDDLEKGRRLDVLFTETILPGLNGIEVCRELRLLDKKCKIVFISTSSELGVASYDVGAYTYLLKPLPRQRFLSVLDKLVTAHLATEDFILTVKTKSGLQSIKYRDILFLESDKHQIKLFASNGKSYVFYGRMSEYQTLLEKDSRFIRCHKGYIINMQHVTSIEDKSFVIHNAHVVPIPKTNIGNIKNKYLSFIATSRTL